MTPQEFRLQFIEFSCQEIYLDSQITLWDSVAQTLVNEERWLSIYDLGIALFIAHHLAVGRRDTLSAESGGIPGAVNGVMTAKSVDKVSASYDVGIVTIADGGFWNSTTYGVRFLQLAMMVGAGGVQI